MSYGLGASPRDIIARAKRAKAMPVAPARSTSGVTVASRGGAVRARTPAALARTAGAKLDAKIDAAIRSTAPVVSSANRVIASAVNRPASIITPPPPPRIIGKAVDTVSRLAPVASFIAPLAPIAVPFTIAKTVTRQFKEGGVFDVGSGKDPERRAKVRAAAERARAGDIASARQLYHWHTAGTDPAATRHTAHTEWARLERERPDIAAAVTGRGTNGINRPAAPIRRASAAIDDVMQTAQSAAGAARAVEKVRDVSQRARDTQRKLSAKAERISRQAAAAAAAAETLMASGDIPGGERARDAAARFAAEARRVSSAAASAADTADRAGAALNAGVNAGIDAAASSYIAGKETRPFWHDPKVLGAGALAVGALAFLAARR